MANTVAVDNLTKSYDGENERVRVFEDLSFEVKENEFLVILGPSGCGKTTLLKSISGIVEPDYGSIYKRGKRITDPTSDIAMVFQDYALLPWKTVVENVTLPLEVQNRYDEQTRRERALEWLDKVGLGDVVESYPTDLSGGMKQRVGLARALTADPEMLLLDEPFASLDYQTKTKLQTKLLELWSEGNKSILYITHDIHEALYLADRILVLSEKPASIIDELHIDFERPRYQRRLEIEKRDLFKKHKRTLRRDLGLES